MSTAPTLMDIIQPPGNPWLQKVSKSKAGTTPEGVRVVRFSAEDDDDSAPRAKGDDKRR